MTTVSRRYSEPYRATGGLAAVGILNQLGRPDAEALETLVREAVQNCWDAKIRDRVRVHIGRLTLTGDRLTAARSLLADPPPGLPVEEALVDGARILFFADEGTHGLHGPVRADEPGIYRDWVDLVLNVGQPPDKDLAGGSFGYGKAAFYLAGAARTVVIDTLCRTEDGRLERRLIASGLGSNYRDDNGRPYTGRHWWGDPAQTDPVPMTGEAAAQTADALGLPARGGPDQLGTTVAVVGFDLQPPAAGEPGPAVDPVMRFIGEAIVWNFWPRMIDTPGSVRRTIEFTLTDDGRKAAIPNPRTHPRLRDFATAMDRLREEPGAPDDDFVLDRTISRQRPTLALGRLVIARGVDPGPLTTEGLTVGARVTANGIHHVALMRTPEIVVRYLPGEPCSNPRFGYSGVFRCEYGLDSTFREAEPPAHDDWIAVALQDRTSRSHVNLALNRIREVCRAAAGYSATSTGGDTAGIALGEFADTLAVLLPGGKGPGARRETTATTTAGRRRRRHTPANPEGETTTTTEWSEAGELPGQTATGEDPQDRAGRPDDPDNPTPVGDTSPDGPAQTDTPPVPRPRRRPQIRIPDDPELGLDDDGSPLLSQTFELRTHHQPVRVTARVEVMTTDGLRVEDEAPIGEPEPEVTGWSGPDGSRHHTTHLDAPADADGRWQVDIRLNSPAMVRIDLGAEPATTAPAATTAAAPEEPGPTGEPT